MALQPRFRMPQLLRSIPVKSSSSSNASSSGSTPLSPMYASEKLYA